MIPLAQPIHRIGDYLVFHLTNDDGSPSSVVFLVKQVCLSVELPKYSTTEDAYHFIEDYISKLE